MKTLEARAYIARLHKEGILTVEADTFRISGIPLSELCDLTPSQVQAEEAKLSPLAATKHRVKELLAINASPDALASLIAELTAEKEKQEKEKAAKENPTLPGTDTPQSTPPSPESEKVGGDLTPPVPDEKKAGK